MNFITYVMHCLDIYYAMLRCLICNALYRCLLSTVHCFWICSMHCTDVYCEFPKCVVCIDHHHCVAARGTVVTGRKSPIEWFMMNIQPMHKILWEKLILKPRGNCILTFFLLLWKKIIQKNHTESMWKNRKFFTNFTSFVA